MLRNIRPPEFNQQQYQQHMMRGMQNGAMNMKMNQGNPLQRAAMANNQKYVLSETKPRQAANFPPLSALKRCICSSSKSESNRKWPAIERDRLPQGPTMHHLHLSGHVSTALHSNRIKASCRTAGRRKACQASSR